MATLPLAEPDRVADIPTFCRYRPFFTQTTNFTTQPALLLTNGAARIEADGMVVPALIARHP